MANKTFSDLVFEAKYAGTIGDDAVRDSLVSYMNAIPSTALVGPKFAIFGTSITNQNTYNILPPNNNPSRVWWSDGYATWLRILTDQRINLSIDDNYGVSGNSFAEMLARIDTVVNSRPDYVIVEGGTNDFQYFTYEDIRTNWLSIVNRFHDEGIIPIVVPAPPRVAGVLTTDQLQTQHRFYNFQREYCYANRGFLFCDYYGSWMDQTNASSPPLANRVRPDGVHPNTTGAYYLGRALADLIIPLLPPRPTSFLTAADIYSAANPTGNLLLSGTTNLGLLAGTGGAQVASPGLTYAGSGFASGSFFQRQAATSVATVTMDKENPRTDAGRMSGERQVIQIAASNVAGADESYQMLYTMSLANIDIGDWYYAEASIEVTGAPVNVHSLELRLLETRTSQTQFSSENGYLGTLVGSLPPVTWKGTYRTAPIIRQSNAIAIQLFLIARLNTSVNPASITFKVGDLAVRKVDPSFI